MQNTSWPCATSHSMNERPVPRSSTYQRLISDGTSRTGVLYAGRAGEKRSRRHLFSAHTTECGVAPTTGCPFGARLISEMIESSGVFFGAFIMASRVERLEAVAQPVVDRLAAQLERRGERAVLDGQRELGDEVLLDRLVARELGVDLLDAR